LGPDESKLRAEGWVINSDVPFINLIGPIWEKPEGDVGRFAFLAQDKHQNRRDVVHGGMLMAFSDRALGLTSRRANGDLPQATVQLDFQFLDAVQVGDWVEARCTVVRRTRFLMFMTGTLTVGDREVMRANGIWKALKPPT